MLSTRSSNRPYQRLARTAKIQETVLLGSGEEADKALAIVHRLHKRVKGTLPETAGVHAAGTSYSAFDPELMLWLRRGRNNVFFDIVTRAERERGGTKTPQLSTGA
jgi:uncharacterized protein (DUF2236 family)